MPTFSSAPNSPIQVLNPTLASNPLTSIAEGSEMLYYALVFFVIALVAALLGFGGVAVAFAGIAKLLFVVFIVLFLVSLVMHLGRRV
jgi:uncharacterized membrane protein YtjA (UPF0391 family)